MDNRILAVCTAAATLAFSASAEEPYAFRKRLEIVHRADRRDVAARCAADEYELRDGLEIALPETASALVRRAAADFVDYLSVSMDVDARVTRRGLHYGAEGVLSAGLATDYAEVDRMALKPHGYSVSVGDGCLSLAGADERAVAQAFYHLEDLMNLRRGPYLKKGTHVRTPRFDVRMTHSGYGNDIFPDEHLNAMAHAGMTAILVFLDDIDKTKAQPYQDIKALIRRAAKYGLDTYLYSYIKAFAHPDDGDAAFRESYGRIAGYYPEAKGIILVGESCQFPSKDSRVQPRTWKTKDKSDPRPLAGWFPCSDYHLWLKAVQRAIRERAPDMEVVFWTYNWGWAPTEDRMKLIDSLPKDVKLMATYEMFERQTKRNGLDCPTADYTISFAGPGAYFVSEAERAKRNGLALYTQANAGGLTWDFGMVPFEPFPFQWKARWDGLVEANATWGLSGIMENHHFGWWPSFVSELEKEAFTEGGIAFDDHVRMIAARDYGAENAERAVAVWRKWSAAIRDYVPSDANQYGPFRIGPAYPFSFGRGKVDPKTFPLKKYASNGVGIVRMDYLLAGYVAQLTPERMDAEYMKMEVDLLEGMAAAFDEGATAFGGMPGEAARRMANFGHYLKTCVRTGINTKRGAIAELEKDGQGILAAARAEYANANEALRYVEADSRLGWEPSLEYGGGPEQIRWKLDLMRRTYPEIAP